MAAAERKFEADLTERDFHGSPVWRFAPADQEGEPTVEPCREPGISFALDGPYLVAVRAVLASGSACPGFVRIGRLMNFVEEGPLTLFLDGRQLEVKASIPGWAGTQPVCAMERQLLPIRWSAAVAAAGEKRPRAGSVSGSRLVYFVKSTIRGLRVQGAR